MERLFQRFSRLLREDDFRRFQCAVAGAIYDQLSRGYLSNEDEVALVGRIVQATNGARQRRTSVIMFGVTQRGTSFKTVAANRRSCGYSPV